MQLNQLMETINFARMTQLPSLSQILFVIFLFPFPFFWCIENPKTNHMLATRELNSTA